MRSDTVLLDNGTREEGIEFNGFNTVENNLKLIERSAPTPPEKEITENLPFVQGTYDFSDILGERIYNNRPLRYVFHVYERDYDRRKHGQTVLENKLMSTHITNLYDTHDPSYYYLGKCVSVETDDDHRSGRLVISIEFDCSPFKKSRLPEGHDIWDEFNFELDIDQQTYFEINGTDTVSLFNNGTVSVVPTITTDSEFEIQKGNTRITVQSGTYRSEKLRLDIGENILSITGNGSIEFDFYKELI